MIREYTLSNGKTARIEVDDMLIDCLGKEWGEREFKDQVRSLEKEIESQE